jgi:hypothetical protein
LKSKTAIVILLPLTLLAIVLLVLASIPSGPAWIPEEPPQEGRRVTHPTGFSIVKPPGWLERISQKGGLHDDAIYLRGNDKKVRFSPHLYVTSSDQFSLMPERGHPHYVSNYVETEFLKMKAFERTDLRAGNGDYFTREIWVTNKGRWYNLFYQIPADTHSPPITNVPPSMLPYLESFRPEP